MTATSRAPQAVALLRKTWELASRRAVAERLPARLPGLLVDEGLWSPEEALARIDTPPGTASPAALADLAPRLPAALALKALQRAKASC